MLKVGNLYTTCLHVQPYIEYITSTCTALLKSFFDALPIDPALPDVPDQVTTLGEIVWQDSVATLLMTQRLLNRVTKKRGHKVVMQNIKKEQRLLQRL